HKHIGDPLPNVMLIRPDVPLWACRVIERLMNKKPKERYQSAGEVVAEFEKYNSDKGYTEPVSNEIIFDIPEVTARINSAANAPQTALERSDPHPSDRQPAPPPPPPPLKTLQDKAALRGQKPVLQFAALHNSLKMAVHLALTLAGTGCFILTGASGAIPGSLSSPLSSNPVTALMLAVAGFVLYAWALWQKPLKFTLGYTFFALGAAVAAYSGGAYIPAPQGADTVTRGFLALKIGLENIFSGANLIVYALFLYLAASKAVFKGNWIFKALAVTAYLGGLALTYIYFKAGAEIDPEKIWLAAGGLLALLGLIAALTQKEFSLFFNPQFLFLAANLAMFSMFTNPQIENITVRKARVEDEAAKRTNNINLRNYRQAVMAAQTGGILYDEEGRPLKSRLPRRPDEVKPPERGKLQLQARLEYYKALGLLISGTLAGSAGIIFIALFLVLMANACFIEELAAAYRAGVEELKF
ncbi:MAG: hypothetical protein AAB359_09410, partial [Elusimicrobiota bacterium]